MNPAGPQRPNPFPGLRPFRSDEHHLFFGREEQTAALLQLLRTNRFLAVVGTSGSGKSSLVRAGMIAALHGGTMTQAGSAWEVMILRPGGSPIENLARAFVDAELYDPADPSTLPRLLATLNRSRFGLVEAMKQSDLFEPGTNMLVVVDQFEELFRFRQQGVDSEETAAAFVNLLLTASEQTECPIYVAITMRSDYLGDCSEIPGLAEAVNNGEYLIPRLQRDQKRDAIEKPIGVGGAKISPLLVQRLLNDVGDDPDQLPVLQHALMRMWDAWAASAAGSGPDRPIEISDFEATGGLAAALSNHADEIYDSLPDDRHRSACEKIFKALTEKGNDNRGIRRPTRLARLQAIADSPRDTVTVVLDAFRGSGVTFLMPATEVQLWDRTVLDLSHESLMRGWQRLRGWVEDEAQSARIFRRLLDTARLWSDGKAGLFRDPDLQIALSWRQQVAPNADWAEQYGGHFETAIRFLETSNAEAQAERQAQEAARQRVLEHARQLAEAQQLRLEQQQRAARKLRKLIAGLGVVAVIAGVACVAALFANKRANTLADDARRLADNARQNEEKATQNARRAEQSQKETANALAVVASEKTEVEDSLSKARKAESLAGVAVENGRKLQYTTDMRLAPFVWRDDRTTADQLRVLLAKHIPHGKATGNETDPAAAVEPELRGFEWYYYQNLLLNSATVLSGYHFPAIASAFTSNGQLMTLHVDDLVRRWDLDSQREDESSRRGLTRNSVVQSHVLSPDGRLAALSEDSRVHVFDTSTGKETYAIDSADNSPTRMIFSRDSKRLVVVGKKVRWHDASSGKLIASVDRPDDNFMSLALSADGLTLAVVGQGPSHELFSVFRLDATTRTAAPLKMNIGRGATLNAAAVSPDGQRIAVGYRLSGSLSVFDTATGEAIAGHGSAHASHISAIAFSDDGTRLATADAQGTIKIWADPLKLTAKSSALSTLKGHQGEILGVVFSPDGAQLASVSDDNTARVWDLKNAGAAIRPLEDCGPTCMARFSPDGLLIAAAERGERRGVRLWDAATGRLVRELPAVDKGQVQSVAFSPADSRLLAVGYGGQADVSYVALYDIDAGTELARLPGATSAGENDGAVGALAFSPDGKYLVAGLGSRFFFTTEGFTQPLKVWDVATRRLMRRLSGHAGYCTSLGFSKDGTLLASGSRDGTAIIWSTATWKAKQTLQNPDRDSQFSPLLHGTVEDVAFAPNGLTLAMASREGNVHLWLFADGTHLETLQGHSSAVQALVFSPDGRTLATGSSDQTVRLWNVQTRRELMQLDPGGIELGQVFALAFSPDGKELLSGGNGAAFWSAAPIVWNDPDRGAERLRLLLNSNADFKSRIRMLSENLRLYESLEKLDSKDVRVQAALAATQANSYASRQAWPQAVAAFDRLVAADPTEPGAWLRVPGLLRLATALLNQNRPSVAAMLLQGSAKRLVQDGPASISKVSISTVDRPGNSTSELISQLLKTVETRLGDNPHDAGLLELRAEIAAAQADFATQVADYNAAMTILQELPPEAASARLRRLHRNRGDSYVNLKKWQEAVDDYAHVITPETTDVDLLSNRARAHEALKNWEAAAADWSRAATGNPDAAKLLAEFARRLVAGGQPESANAQFEQSQSVYERLMQTTPENDLIVPDLAQVMLDKNVNQEHIHLSVSGNQARLDQTLDRAWVTNAHDPMLKLAGAYALNGRNDEALQYFNSALKRADGYDGRKPVLELAARFGEILSEIVKRQPDDPQLQLALARQDAERGKRLLAENHPAEAQATLEKSRDILIPLRANITWQGVQVRHDLNDGEMASLYTALGNACAQQGKTNDAVASFMAALPLAAKNAEKAKIINEAARLQGVLDQLAESAAGDDRFQAELARYFIDRDNLPAAHAALSKARGLFEDKLAKEPANLPVALELANLLLMDRSAAPGREQQRLAAMKLTDAWGKLAAAYHIIGDEQALDGLLKHHSVAAVRIADLYQSIGRTRDGIPYLVKASAANPNDTILSLKVAALQAWFGQDKELADTRQRILAFARGTVDPNTAERAAKSCCIVASIDKAELETAMALSRISVERGGSKDWCLMTRGITEYRNGNYAAADENLVAAAKAGPTNSNVANTSAFYHAMCLFRQDKADDARNLATAAAAKMKPLPKDENNPLTGNAKHDDLIQWLAYREAKTMIHFDADPPPK